MSDPNLPDTTGFTPFQPVYSNPRNGQLITLCQILEALKSGGSSPASSVNILTDGTAVSNSHPLPATLTGGTVTLAGGSNNVGSVNVANQTGVATLGSGNTPTTAFYLGYSSNGNFTGVTNNSPLPISINAGTNTIGSVNAPSGSITMSNSSVGTSSATLLAASSASKMLTIQNTSASNTLYVSTTSPATSTNGIAIGAGVGYQFPYIPTNALYCLGSAASTTYTIWYA